VSVDDLPLFNNWYKAIPNWTVQSALDHLEDEYSADELLNRGGAYFILWLKRMYNLINLMRWVRVWDADANYYLHGYQQYLKMGGVADTWPRIDCWNGAIAGYNSNDFIEYNYYGPAVTRWIYGDDSRYIVCKGKYKLSSGVFIDSRYGINFDDPDIKATASIWMKSALTSGTEYRDLFLTGVGCNAIVESAIFPENNFKDTDLITDEFIPQEWQDYPEGEGDYRGEIHLTPIMLLFKFDGPNGFKFLTRDE
jgi:hypothetical protein